MGISAPGEEQALPYALSYHSYDLKQEDRELEEVFHSQPPHPHLFLPRLLLVYENEKGEKKRYYNTYCQSSHHLTAFPLCISPNSVCFTRWNLGSHHAQRRVLHETAHP